MRRDQESSRDGKTAGRLRAARLIHLVLATAALLLTLAVGLASASKQVVNSLGGDEVGTLGGQFNRPFGVAVNESGAGPADRGDLYVADSENNRIQRFARSENDTPASPADDTYEFLGAWGAGVKNGGNAYEICTVASECKAGTPTGGNGSISGNGDLNKPAGIAVDQDTGEVYVADAGNHRVNVYEGDGTFLRSFGYDVVASGPNDKSAPSERQQLTVNATGGHFSLAFEGKATAARGAGAREKNSKIVELSSLEGSLSVGEGISGPSILPGTTVALLEPGAIKLSKAAVHDSTRETPLLGDDLPANASAAEVQAALNALPSIGGVGGSVTVTGGPAGSALFQIEFGGTLAGADQPPLAPTWRGLEGSFTITLEGASGGSFRLTPGIDPISTTRIIPANASAAELQSALEELKAVGAGNVTVSGPAGGPWAVRFSGATAAELLRFTADGSKLTGASPSVTISPPAAVTTLQEGGTYETCVAAAGDACRAGSPGSGTGEVGEGSRYTFEGGPMRESPSLAAGIAVNAPDGNPATGTVFLADRANHRVDSYGLDGSDPASIGAGVFSKEERDPEGIAVDSSGILYATDHGPQVFAGRGTESKIERYDTTGVNGAGVGFLAPISGRQYEVQRITVDAAAGSYRLTFDGESTGDIAYDASAGKVNEELEKLISIGSGNVSCSLVNVPDVHIFECRFEGGLAEIDVEQIGCEDGSVPLSGGTGCTVETLADGHMGPVEPPYVGLGTLAVDLQTGVLYAGSRSSDGLQGLIDQFGPANPPGLLAPPTAVDDVHGDEFEGGHGITSMQGIAVDGLDGTLYASSFGGVTEQPFHVYVLAAQPEAPTVSLEALNEATARTLTAHATIDPNGAPPASYRVEYRQTGESSWAQTQPTQVGSQETPQAVTAVLDPPGGLLPDTSYEVRLAVSKPGVEPVLSAVLSATTLTTAPDVETVGSPIRTAETALMSGRLDPNGTASTYRFQYGDEGPCDSNPCEETEPESAGSGQEVELVAQRAQGLAPNTTYHYRLVGESAAPDSPSYGQDMTLTTRASDEPLSHGHLSGPPGSDRAYEQVNMSDTGGNPVPEALGFATNGERALFVLAGGSPDSDTGSLLALFYSERTASGWKVKQVTPPREELVGSEWADTVATPELSRILSANREFTTGEATIWRFNPPGSPNRLYDPSGSVQLKSNWHPAAQLGISADGSLQVAELRGAADPSYPGAGKEELYDVGSSPPRLLSLLPDGSACPELDQSPPMETEWVSADGARVYFGCEGQLYVREVAAAQTKLLSGPALSGPRCDATFLRSSPEAAYYFTRSRLAGADTVAPGGCKGQAGGDVYRYYLATETPECLTCVVPGGEANVTGGRASSVLSYDGSRLYFRSTARLLAGTPPGGGTYRLDLESDDLAYVGPLTELLGNNSALTPDGSALLFRSDDPRLDQLGGQQNGGSAQYYLYQDEDRALSCASCPQDGSAPVGDTKEGPQDLAPGLEGPNQTLLSADGGVLAFATPTPLLNADQNTASAEQSPEAGEDAYEWRDGRLLLVTDGLSNWPTRSGPRVASVSPSGRDIFFLAAAQYTPDALDGYRRLYDARIGGGFEFPEPPPPCPLEVCQGTPKGAPEEQESGSANFVGPGNAAPKAKAHKKQKQHRKRHAKKKQSKNKHSHRAAKPHGRSHR